MHFSVNNFCRLLAILGMVWIGALLLIGWTTRRVSLDPMQPWICGADAQMISHGSIPEFERTGRVIIGLKAAGSRFAICAAHSCPGNGTLESGPARLVIPPHVVSREDIVNLEDCALRSSAVVLSKRDMQLGLSPLLKISYANPQFEKQGFEPASLEMFREITPGIYERIPSRVNLQEQCVIGEPTCPGRYVIG
jgi:hypothetical protein